MRTVIVLYMRTIPALALLTLLTPLLVGCGPATGSRTANGTSVVVAFYPLAFAAQEIGGGAVDVRNLTPPGSEPHDIELRPRDVAAIQSADAVFYLSHGFQPAVEQAAGGAHGTRVDALAGIALRSGIGDESGKADPHIWLDPVLFARVVTRIGHALGRPRRAAALRHRVLALNAAYRRGLARCDRREFVTSHAAFGYLAARYHLHQVAITGLDPQSEPSAQRLKSLSELVRRDGETTVFFEKLVSPKLAQTVAREAGARTAVLDPIEGLTTHERNAGDDYLTLMRRNLAQLRTALACR